MTPTSQILSTLAPLSLQYLPVAIAFQATPPSGMARVDRAQPAGCGYWKEAAEGRSFYTTPDDHLNCPIGAYTHGAPLSAGKEQELQSMIGTMVELKYLKSEEVPTIPRQTAAWQAIAYAPLPDATFPPDVVVFRGNARQIMTLSEAARAAGVLDAAILGGRPTCSMIPQTKTSGLTMASVGCIGSRVYTDLGDDELYLSVPGAAIDSVMEQLGAIINANQALEAFHRQRDSALRP